MLKMRTEQWVYSNSIVKQKDMLILHIRVKVDRLVKTMKEIKVPNGMNCYSAKINAPTG